MNRYIAHMHTKTTHERRQHAAKIAGILTSVVFLGWVATLGMRFATPTTQIANENDGAQQTQLANVMNGSLVPQDMQDNSQNVQDTQDTQTTSVPGLEVATTSQFIGQ